MTNQLRQVLLFVFAFIFYALANATVYPVNPGKDSTKLSNKNSEPPLLIEENVTRDFPELDEHLKDQLTNFSLDYSTKEPEFNEEYLEEHFNRNPKTDTLMAKAYRLFQTVEGLGSFVDKITGKELLKLPIGMRKRDSTGNTVTLAISEVEFTPQHAIIKAFAKLEIPEKGSNNQKKELIFGAENIILTHDGGLAGDMRLVLLGDVGIPINGDQWLITLKGSIDLKKDGAFSEDSYIEFNCDGLKQIGLKGEVRVSRELLKPLNQDGTQKCSNMGEVGLPEPSSSQMDCYVGTTFNIQTSGWNDIFLEVDLDPFEVVGLDGWGFYTQNVVLDLSDLRGSTQMRLPNEYDAIYGGADLKLWRGFYAEEISVMLPQGIEDKNASNGRVRFGATNLILDSQGISGTFFGENVLTAGNGLAGEWAFTIENVSLTLLGNNIQEGSLGGDISVPILKQPMQYDGYIGQNGYGLQVGFTENYKAPVFMGEISLAPNSSVGIEIEDGSVYPYANLTGSMTVIGSIDDTEESVESRMSLSSQDSSEGNMDVPNENDGAIYFAGIAFEELELQTKPGTQPIQAKKFGYEGNMNLMNFPATVNNLKLISPNNKVGLEFDLSINIDESGSAATTKLAILGNQEENGNSWKFDKVEISAIDLRYSKSGIVVEGKLEIMKDDPVYGNGFKGELNTEIKEANFKALGKGIFGATDFRYWSVDIWTDNNNDKSQSKFLIKSFVGGVSNKMRKVNGASDAFNVQKNIYEPDIDTGLGIRAGVFLSSGNEGTFAAKAYLDMEFNVHGGINRLGFIGEGAFMADETYVSETNTFGKLNQTLDEIDSFITDIESDVMEAMGKDGDGGQASLTKAKEAIPLREVATSGKVGVYVGIEKDFVNKTFEGEFELYIETVGLRGGGTDNMAGYAKMYSSPTDWYFYLGTPQQPISLVFDMKTTELEVRGYFMTGTQLPSQLDPHPQVVKILGRDMINGNRQESQLQAGRGFAFGLSFVYRKKFEYLIFYASIEAGAGFDVMHAYYPDAQCVGRSGPVGNNGWYSMGQVYAYIYGEFGIDVNLFFIKGKFQIAEAGIAAMLRGQFPNPVYIQGYVGMYYNILGGLVKGRMRLKVEMGEECELTNLSEGVGVPIISDVSPREGEDNVPVFAAPQAVFNYVIDQEVTVELESGIKTYKIKLNSFKVTSDGNEIEGDLEWNESNDVVTFKPNVTLPGNKEIRLAVEVTFEELINGSFQTLKENGNPVKERKEVTFQTDLAPDHIVLENVEYMYPIKNQQQFYPEEFKTGYLKMITPQDYLFDSGYEMRAEFKLDGEGIRTNLNYDPSTELITFDIPDMVLESEYELDYIVFPPGADIPTHIVIAEEEVNYNPEEAGDTTWYNPNDGSQETKNTSATVVVGNKKVSSLAITASAPKSIFNYQFRTSRYETFKQKVEDLVVTDELTNLSNLNLSSVHSLSLAVEDYEYLDKMEILGDRLTNNKPLIFAQAILDDSYFKNQIKPLIYEEYPLNGTIYFNREEDSSIKGVPPIRSFRLSNNYLMIMEYNPNSYWVKNRIPFIYSLPAQYRADLDDLRNQIATKYQDNPELRFQYRYLNVNFPPMPLGKYKAELIYRTPGNIYSNGYRINYKNN